MKKMIFAILAFATALTTTIAVHAVPRNVRVDVNRDLRPGERIELGRTGLVLANQNRYSTYIQSVMLTVDDNSRPPFPGRTFETPSRERVECGDPNLGGAYGAIKVSCRNTGRGNNHRMYDTPNGCYAKEGPNNGGNPACACTCRY